MKKRTIITVLSVAGLLIVAFIAGSVLAQGDVTGSTSGQSSPQTYSLDESQPRFADQVNGAADSSSSLGGVMSVAAAALDESEVGSAAQVDVNGQSSTSSGAALDVPGAPSDEAAPVMSMVNAAGGPNAPAWNSNIRYVGSTLKPRANNVNYTVGGTGGGCVYATGGDAFEVWNTPLTLPDGAQVEWLRLYFYDNDGTNNIRGWFTKYNLYGDIVSEWGVSSTSGGYGYVDVAISPVETINYNNYSYVLNFRPYVASSNLMLCGFRVFYTVFGNTFMPSILR
jgi:hypothetical protein